MRACAIRLSLRALGSIASLLGWGLLITSASAQWQDPSAWESFQRGNYEEALDGLEKEARLYPYSPIPLDGIGWCHYYLGNVLGSEEWFKKALELDEEYKWSLQGLEAVETWRWSVIERARTYYYGGDYELGAAWYRIVISEPERLPDVDRWRGHAGLGLCLDLLGQPEQAIESLLTALKMDPHQLPTLRGLAQAYYNLGKWSSAGKYVDRALKEGDDWVSTPRLGAWIEFRRGSAIGAKRAFEAVLQQEPQDGSAWYGLGMCSTQPTSKQIDFAAFDKAAELSPLVFEAEWLDLARASADWNDLRLRHGWSLIQHGWSSTAAERFAEMVEDGAEPEAARLGQAHALFALGDYSGAQRVLAGGTGDELSIVEMATAGPTVLITSNASSLGAWCLLKLGQTEEAQSAFESVLVDHADWIDSRCGLGWALLARGSGDAADEHFSRALKLAPTYSDALAGRAAVQSWRTADYQAARSLYYSGEYEAALEGAERILAGPTVFPKDQQHLIYDLMGWVYLAQGETDSARSAFDRSLKSEPEFFTSMKGTALCEFVRGDYSTALELAGTILESFPGATDILSLQGWCLLRTELESEAIGVFSEAIEAASVQGIALPDAHRGRGWAQVGLNLVAEARADFAVAAGAIPLTLGDPEFRALVESRSEYHSLAGDLGWALLYADAYSEAADWLALAGDLIPEESSYRRGQGLAHYYLGQWDQAIEILKRLVRSAPKSETGWGAWSAAYSALGWSELYADDARAALKTFSALKALHKGDDFWPDPHNGLGWANLALDSKTRAKRAFEDALRCTPDYASALQGLAQAEEDTTP